MKQSSSEEDVEKVKEKAIQQGHEPLVIYGVERNVVAVSGKVNDDHRAVMKLLPNVSRVIPVGKPYKLASKNYKKDNSIVKIKDLSIGGDKLAIIAGPDSAETQEQTIETALAAKEAGSNGLRGGAFKPRTSPYSFQGLGEDGLKMLKEASEITSLPLFSDIKYAEFSLMKGPNFLESSPISGASIFITLAPKSDNIIVQYGPTNTLVRSTTNKFFKGPSIISINCIFS